MHPPSTKVEEPILLCGNDILGQANTNIKVKLFLT